MKQCVPLWNPTRFSTRPKSFAQRPRAKYNIKRSFDSIFEISKFVNYPKINEFRLIEVARIIDLCNLKSKDFCPRQKRQTPTTKKIINI